MGPESYSRTRQWQGIYALNHRFNNNWSMRFGVYGRDQHVERLWIDSASTVLAFTGSGASLVRTAARSGSYDPERDSYSVIPQLQVVGQFNYAGINHKFITGYEYSYVFNSSAVYTKALARIDIDRPQPDSVYSYGDVSTYTLNSQTNAWAKSQGVPITNIFSMFHDRLTVLQGWRFGSVTNDSKNLRAGTASPQFNQNATVQSYGASFRVIPKKLTAFASYSESFVPQSGTEATSRAAQARPMAWQRRSRRCATWSRYGGQQKQRSPLQSEPRLTGCRAQLRSRIALGPRQNLIGPAIQRIRRGQMLTQADLASRYRESGFDLGPTEVAKIECGVRCVTDVETVALARLLAVEPGEFFQLEAVIEEPGPPPKGLSRARPVAKRS